MTNLLLRDLVEATGTVGPGWMEGGEGNCTSFVTGGDAIIKGDVLLLTCSHV